MDTEKIEYHEKGLLLSLLIVVSLIYSTLGSLPSGRISIHLDSFAINFLYSAVVLFLLKLFIDFLDRNLPWTISIQKRFTLQLLSTLLLYILLQSLIIFIIEPATGGKAPRGSLLINTYLLGMGFLMFANAIYLMQYIKHNQSLQQVEVAKKSDSTNRFITGSLKGKRVNTPLNRIIHLYIINGLAVAITDEKEKILLQESLSDIESELDKENFYRANRQHIITKKIIKEISYLPNKTSAITLESGEEVIVSRYKTPQFKKWLS